MLPPWQVLVALAALTFACQHKLVFVRDVISRIHPALAECSFCLGFHLGWAGWLAAVGVTGHSFSGVLVLVGSCGVWALSSAALSLVLDALTA